MEYFPIRKNYRTDQWRLPNGVVLENGTGKLCYIGSIFKGSRTGHVVKVSLWYAPLLTNTRFRFLILE